MQKIFNSRFENSLRIILLLDAFGISQNVDMLYAVDFMAVYGKTFGISDEDLNGDNQYKFSEFASRRSVVQNALKELVLDGLAKPYHIGSGIVFQITPEGKDFCRSLDSDYAQEYSMTARKAVELVDGKSERAVIAAINKMSAQSAGKEAAK